MEKFTSAFNGKVSLIIRFILWIGLTVVCPIIFISTKFGLIEKSEDNTIKFTGWGIISILIVALFIFFLIKWVIKNFAYNYWLGVLNGFISLVLWLILAKVMCQLIVNYIERVNFVLSWSIVTCSIGVLLNPMPYLAHINRINKIKKELGAE